MQKLQEIVRATEQFRLAEAEGKLLRLWDQLKQCYDPEIP